MAQEQIQAGQVHRGEPTYMGLVYPWQCDHMEHLNVMWYVGKFDEATWVFFHQLGLTPDQMRDNRRGMAALEQHLTYKRELFAGDTVKIFSKVTKVGAKVIHFTHEMVNAHDGAVAAICDLTAIHTDLDARKAARLPDNVIARARQLIAEAG